MGKKVMIDSNTWISGLIFRRNEMVLIDSLISEEFRILTCQTVKQEVIRTLARKFNISPSRISYFESYLDNNTIEIPEREAKVPFDDNDLRILDTAIRSDCDYFITGDKRLLGWGSFGKLQIIRTVEMLEIIERAVSDHQPETPDQPSRPE
jgi:putative PIN family toxin of toxin-antitoxin system